MKPHAFDPDAAATGASGIYGLPFTPDAARVVVVPVPFEATTSYGGGTSRGPAAVLEASKQVDLFDRDTGRPYAAGIAMLDIPKKIERWNRQGKTIAALVIERGGAVDKKTRSAAEKVNAISEKMNEWVYTTTRSLLDDNRMPVILDPSSWPNWLGEELAAADDLKAMLVPYPAAGMTCWPVSKRVSNVKNNDPSLVYPV